MQSQSQFLKLVIATSDEVSSYPFHCSLC